MPLRCLPALLTACLLVTVAVSGLASAFENPANPLITDRGKFRPLILVTPSAGDDDYRRMREQLQQRRDAFDQHQMVLYAIEGGNGQRAGRAMTRFETHALLDAVAVGPQGPLTVILIGKDGGKKMQLEGYVAPQQVFDIIDRMPMRQSEIRSDTQHEESQ